MRKVVAEYFEAQEKFSYISDITKFIPQCLEYEILTLTLQIQTAN